MSDFLTILIAVGGIGLLGGIIGFCFGILWIAPRFYHFTRIANHVDYLVRLPSTDQFLHKTIVNLAKIIYHDLFNYEYEENIK